MTELPKNVDELKAVVKQLLEENVRLKAESTELCCRLGTDSSNNDKLPSSDGYKKKTVKTGLPKDKKGNQGGQKGHKGNTLKRVEQTAHV